MIRPGFIEVKDNTPVVHAAELLKQASSLDPTDPYIHFACVSALFIGAQFRSAEDELKRLLEAHPTFPLAQYSLDAFAAGKAIQNSTIFSVPEWTAAARTVPACYTDNTPDFTILPARERIYPRVVVFEKDFNRWWTQSKLQGLQAEIAIVLVSGPPNVTAIYRRCIGPGLEKPDVQECADVLQSPENDISRLAWQYLTLVDCVEVILVDPNNNVLLAQRVALSNQTKNTLGHVREILLRTSGTRVSAEEKTRALLKYSNQADLGDIERGYFSGEKIF